MFELFAGDNPKTLADIRASLARLQADVTSLNDKVDALLNHANIEYDPYDKLPASVKHALESGDQIEAIRQYRDATGADLQAARNHIQRFQN